MILLKIRLSVLQRWKRTLLIYEEETCVCNNRVDCQFCFYNFTLNGGAFREKKRKKKEKVKIKKRKRKSFLFANPPSYFGELILIGWTGSGRYKRERDIVKKDSLRRKRGWFTVKEREKERDSRKTPYPITMAFMEMRIEQQNCDGESSRVTTCKPLTLPPRDRQESCVAENCATR